jgi:hypothetical protein
MISVENKLLIKNYIFKSISCVRSVYLIELANPCITSWMSFLTSM